MASEIEGVPACSKASKRWLLPWVLGVGLIGSACSDPQPLAHRQRTLADDYSNKVLTIRDLSVIEDPNRALDPCDEGQEGALPPWSFGKIAQKLAEQAGTPDAPTFIKNWLDTWKSTQVVNGHFVEPVPIDQFVTDPWLYKSGGERLNLGIAPFRLLSIINRIDLSANDGKGELRMNYVATNGPDCEPIHFMVIFEFELPVQSADELLDLARRWDALASMPFGESYNAALQDLTDELTSARLKHVNTCEEEASVLEWNYRSFALADGALVNVPLFQSPDVNDEGDPQLVAWVNANEDAILADSHVVPDELLGGDTRNVDWVGVGFADPYEVRHHFALATCSGCHAGETGTSFVHTNRRRRHQQTSVSEYLTGEEIQDPRGRVRIFNAFADRAAYLHSLLQ